MNNNQERRDLALELQRVLAGVRLHNSPYSKKWFDEFRTMGKTSLFDGGDERILRRTIDLLNADLGITTEQGNWS